MITFSEFILEEKIIKKPWPGGDRTAVNWKQISKSEHDEIDKKHDPFGPSGPGFVSKPGMLHANKFDNGEHGTYRSSPKKPNIPPIYRIKHKDGSDSYWVKK